MRAVARAKAGKPDTVRVLVRAEWVEEMPAEDVPTPGDSLSVAGREVTVWSVGAPARAERPACNVRVRAGEDGLLADWQLAALEAAKHGLGPAASRNNEVPPEQPASWGVSVRLVAHLAGGRRLDPVTKHKRELTIGEALDALVDAAEEAKQQWSGGTFGVTGRVVLTADSREQLRAEIARATGGGPADIDGVINALEAITVAAESLYEEAEPGVETESLDLGGSEPGEGGDGGEADGDDDDLGAAFWPEDNASRTGSRVKAWARR